MRIHKHLDRLVKTQVFWESVCIIISDVKLAVLGAGWRDSARRAFYKSS